MIRKLTLAQLPKARALILDEYQHTQATQQTEEQNRSFQAFMALNLLKMQVRAKTVQFYGAFDGDTLQGVAMLRGERLSLLYVSREMKMQGIGRSLVEYLEKQLVNDGFYRMTVAAWHEAAAFYQHLGFVPVENAAQEPQTILLQRVFDCFKLRPHHGLCIHNFVGKGYSEAFIENMFAVTAHLKQCPEQKIQLVVSEDVLCKRCPHHQNGCVSGQKVRQMDRMVLQQLKLAQETTLSWEEYTQKIKRDITRPTASICKSCQWSDTCVEIALQNGEIW